MRKNKIYRCDPDLNIECTKRRACYRNLKDGSGYYPCYSTTNKKYKMSLRKRITEYKENHMTCHQFDKYIRKLDTNKYHVCRSVTFNMEAGKFYVGKWSIYRKNMDITLYFDPANTAILDSEHNTLKDIKKLIKNDKKSEK